MTRVIENLYWDSCVFYCLLTGDPPQHQATVLDLLGNAKSGKAKIYSSTVAFAEIRQTALIKKGHSSIQMFFDAMQGAVILVDAGPNIMMAVGALRDAVPTNPSDANAPQKRSIGLGDAIHLQTCLYLRDTLNVRDIVFHTFDDGKSRGWEGRCVPLLSFERWFPEPRSTHVSDVCGLTRIVPRPRQNSLFNTIGIENAGSSRTALIVGDGNQDQPGQ